MYVYISGLGSTHRCAGHGKALVPVQLLLLNLVNFIVLFVLLVLC